MSAILRTLLSVLAMTALILGGPATAQTPPSPAPVAAASTAAAGYILGPRDKLRIIVYGETALSGEFFVSSNGKLSLPLIGEVQAAGLTVSRLQATIENSLKEGYLKDPRVSAEVLTFRPFYILGEVSKPGEYPYNDGLTVLAAVATAGGFTYRANTKRVFIKGANDTSEKSVKLNSSTMVTPGDTIRVPERFF